MEEPNTHLQTEINAQFVYTDESPVDESVVKSRQILQEEIDLITVRLHTVFRLLIIEMMDTAVRSRIVRVAREEATDAGSE